MSSQIYYDKAFIRVADKGVIPVVCNGSNNCFEFSLYGREIPEKIWNVLNHPNRSKIIFSEDELCDIAKYYESISVESGGGIRKSRNRPFQAGEFERWILAGRKSALSIEEYLRYGNRFYVVNRDIGETHSVTSTEELLALLETWSGSKNLDMTFRERDIYRPRQQRRRTETDFNALDRYYVLKGEIGFFVKIGSRKIYYTSGLERCVKKFVSEKAASRYLDKHEETMRHYAFGIVCIEKENAV